MATDAHTHLLPMRLAEKIRRFFADFMIEDELSYTLDYRELLQSHAAAGFDTVWNLPYAHKAGMAARLNESMLEVADEYGNEGVSIVSGCTVHPDDKDPADDLRTAVASGAGVLKLHCSVGDYEPTDPRLSDVYLAAGELRVPVTIHAGHSITGHTEVSELAPIAQAVADHPDTTFVLAHAGHHSYPEAMELLGLHANLLCDLTPVIYEPVPLTRDDAERFNDRLLFGTDAPNTGRSAAQLLDYLRSIGISDATFHQITSENASALLAQR